MPFAAITVFFIAIIVPFTAITVFFTATIIFFAEVICPVIVIAFRLCALRTLVRTHGSLDLLRVRQLTKVLQEPPAQLPLIPIRQRPGDHQLYQQGSRVADPLVRPTHGAEIIGAHDLLASEHGNGEMYVEPPLPQGVAIFTDGLQELPTVEETGRAFPKRIRGKCVCFLAARDTGDGKDKMLSWWIFEDPVQRLPARAAVECMFEQLVQGRNCRWAVEVEGELLIDDEIV